MGTCRRRRRSYFCWHSFLTAGDIARTYKTQTVGGLFAWSGTGVLDFEISPFWIASMAEGGMLEDILRRVRCKKTALRRAGNDMQDTVLERESNMDARAIAWLM